MHPYESDFSPRVNAIAGLLSSLTVNGCNALRECFCANWDLLAARSAEKFKPNDLVQWHKVTKRNIYKHTGRITVVGRNCKIISSTGGQWSVASYALTKVEE